MPITFPVERRRCWPAAGWSELVLGAALVRAPELVARTASRTSGRVASAANAESSAFRPPEDGRYPVSSTSAPTTRQDGSARASACVISTLPRSPTGVGARTPPICAVPDCVSDLNSRRDFFDIITPLITRTRMQCIGSNSVHSGRGATGLMYNQAQAQHCLWNPTMPAFLVMPRVCYGGQYTTGHRACNAFAL